MSACEAAFLAAYRWQYIHSGARHPYFGKVLNGLITETQRQRIQAALATLH
jgi:phage gp16-like protein